MTAVTRIDSTADLFKLTFGDNLECLLETLNNPAFDTDSYKLSHKHMEPDETKRIYSNFTPRFGYYFKRRFENHDGNVVVFGMQGFVAEELKHSWDKYFFSRPVEEVMEELTLIFFPYIGMNREKLEHFEKLHKLGYLPLKVKALPEGSIVPLNTPVMTIVNTHDDFSWLTNYIESVLSLNLHKPMTVATIARELSQLADYWWDKTVVDQTFKCFAIHDFSLRGHDAKAAARACGAGALLYSTGTDNVPGLLYARTMYGSSKDTAMSVAASEHSVTTLGINFYKDVPIQGELKTLVDQLQNRLLALDLMNEFDQAKGELITLYRLLTERFPEGILSYVADSYDYWRVLTILLPILKDVIMARNGKLVIRPDSGDPVKMVCGYTVTDLTEFVTITDLFKSPVSSNRFDVIKLGDGKYYRDDSSIDSSGEFVKAYTELTKAEIKGSIAVLDEIFGSTTNSKGYKELPPQIGLIYGDGITYTRATGILSGLASKGYAASNVVLGVGSYTFASSTRDDLGFAIKATHAVVGELEVPIYKQPKTDSGKNSAKGLLSVVKENGVYKTLSDVTPEQEALGELQVIFEDSKLFNITTFEEVKARLRS